MIDMTVFSSIDGMEHNDEQQKYDGVGQKKMQMKAIVLGGVWLSMVNSEDGWVSG